jgi:hypothetical protein
LAPPKLAPRLRSLPPILYMTEPHPMTGYSKAPRGLSVQLRVMGVFTHTTTSPSPWSRQRSSRYTIRAGRNFARSSVTRGRRLYLYLEGPRYRRLVAPVDLAFQPVSATPGATWSRYRAAIRGFPRYYPRTVYHRRSGFTDMSRFLLAGSLPRGASCSLPDKEFRYLRQSLLMSP